MITTSSYFYSELLPHFYGIPNGLAFIFALLGFIPARRGHWSAWLLAGPATLLGLLCLAAFIKDWQADTLFFPAAVMLPAPFLTGVACLSRWALARRVKSLPQE